MNGELFIIGCGGVGSWLIPSLIRLCRDRLPLVALDGDTWEKGNLDRQFFNESHLGTNKAESHQTTYGRSVKAIAQWFSSGLLELDRRDWLLVCADNHAARREALLECDLHRCRAIIAANEKTSAEAYYYQRDWKGTALDPRVYYPEILSDRSGDPRAAAIGCTGEAREQTPQLASANFMAAALAQHLFVLWALEWPRINDQTILPQLPYKLNANLSSLETYRIKDTQPKERTENADTNR